MILPILFSSWLSVTPVKETVWWNTTGGKVTELRDQTDASCSLMFYDDSGSIVFEWNGSGKTVVTAIDWGWQFPDNWKLPVAMQVGDVWLSDGSGSAVIQAVGHGTAVSFNIKQPVEQLLEPADHLSIKTTDGQLSIKLLQTKVGALLSHARQCRDAIKG